MHDKISPELIEDMNEIAGMLDRCFNGRELPKRVGFALLTYNFGEQIEGTGRVNYIGNGRRSEVLTALKELVARWEKGIRDASSIERADD
jgi:hypothetical protein